MGKAGRRRVVQQQIETTNESVFHVVRGYGAKSLKKYLGTWNAGWDAARHEFGSRRFILKSTWENRAGNATAMELGVKPGKGIPLDPLVVWLKFRGIAPQSGTRESDYIGFAAAISNSHKRLGWPNAGSVGYETGPPKPVEVGIRQSDQYRQAHYDACGARIARRWGG